MKVVLDANIYISALLRKASPPGTILEMCYQGSIEPVMSKPIYEELERVLCYPKIAKILGINREQAKKLLNRLAKNCIFVTPSMILNVVAEDESDNRYLEAAIAADARYVVTGDQYLLKVEHYQGVEVVSAAGFLAIGFSE